MTASAERSAGDGGQPAGARPRGARAARSRGRRPRRAARPTSAPPPPSAPRRRGWWACTSGPEGLDLDHLREQYRAETGGRPPREVPVRDPQLPEPLRDQPLPGLAPRPARGRARAGPARGRGRPVRRPLLRGGAAAAPCARWRERPRSCTSPRSPRSSLPACAPPSCSGPRSCWPRSRSPSSPPTSAAAAWTSASSWPALRGGLIEEQKARIRPTTAPSAT